MKHSLDSFATALLLVGCGTAPVGPMQHEALAIDLDKSEIIRAELKMGAGDLNVDGGATKLADGEFSFNVASWKPRVEYHSPVCEATFS